MKRSNIMLRYLLVSIMLLPLLNCSKNDDGDTMQMEEEIAPVVLDNEINDFVWRGLNEIYLWKDEVQNLADDRFETTDNYYTFLNGFNTPENLFSSLLYRTEDIDRFSFLVDDYVALEQSFQGNSKTNGLDFRLVRISGSDDVFGYIRYVALNSNASTKDIERGDLFTTVDGQQLNINNFRSLLFGDNDTYTLGLARIENNSITNTNETVELTKTDFTENPILISKVLNVSGTSIGYVMYNSFIANFDNELNNAIGDLKNQGITELVLDLRYNGGGRVSSAIALASMITGQFNGDVLIQQQWNSRYQAFFEQENPERLINRFRNTLADNTPINSLNLSKVYVLSTTGTASASELIINGLSPYIDVVQVGTNTTGKYTASITLYDSSNFGRDNANPNHQYALQPQVFKSANANGVTDYFEGLNPDIPVTYQNSSGATIPGENIANLGTLGDIDEPFLAKAIEVITGATSKNQSAKMNLNMIIEPVADSKDFSPLRKEMYADFIPLN